MHTSIRSVEQTKPIDIGVGTIFASSVANNIRNLRH